MAESYHTTIVSTLKTTLEAVIGDGGTSYWYTPSVVWTVPYFEDRHLDGSHEYILLIRSGDETHEEHASGGMMRADAEVFILVARKYEPATEHPAEVASPDRSTLIDRCVRDVLRAVLANPKLGLSYVENVAAEPVIVDRAQEVEGWALAEIRTVVRYEYQKATP
jgi:hypothetical protein